MDRLNCLEQLDWLFGLPGCTDYLDILAWQTGWTDWMDRLARHVLLALWVLAGQTELLWLARLTGWTHWLAGQTGWTDWLDLFYWLDWLDLDWQAGLIKWLNMPFGLAGLTELAGLDWLDLSYHLNWLGWIDRLNWLYYLPSFLY